MKSTAYRTDLTRFGPPEPHQKAYLWRTLEADAEGRVVADTTFDARGNIVHRTTQVYDAQGNLAEAGELDGVEGLEQRITHQRDDHGREIEEIHYFGTEIFQRITTAYDNAGRKTEQRVYDEDETLMQCTEWKHHPNGLPASQTIKNAEGEIESIIVFKHDDLGRLCEELTLGPKGELISRNSVEFYGEGQQPLLTEATDGEGNIDHRVEVELDENGRPVRQLHTGDNLDYEESFEYDSQGRKTLRVLFDHARNICLAQEEWRYAEDGRLSETTAFEFHQGESKKEIYHLRWQHSAD